MLENKNGFIEFFFLVNVMLIDRGVIEGMNIRLLF